jgi:CheY-like chemotaxis protein
LVVDDEQDTADALMWLVRRWGHAARLAYDGVDALQAAADQFPDVVLLDIEMPFMDGCQVARRLRLDFPGKECFIIAVTGRTDDKRRQQCTAAGIDLVLFKPVDPTIVETLLLLECELANRSRTDNGPDTSSSSRITSKKPSVDERDGAAKRANSRRWQALRADNNRRSLHATGGSSC